MMAGLFFIFVVNMLLVWRGLRKPAIILAIVNLLLCLAMLWHHVTTKIDIML
jgi:hypothetical protein